MGVRDDTRRGSASLLVALPEFGVLGFEFDFDFDFRFVGFLFARFPLLGFFLGESATELSEHRGDQTGAMDPSSHVRVVFVCAVRKHVHTHHVRRTARTDSAEAR